MFKNFTENIFLSNVDGKIEAFSKRHVKFSKKFGMKTIRGFKFRREGFFTR